MTTTSPMTCPSPAVWIDPVTLYVEADQGRCIVDQSVAPPLGSYLCRCEGVALPTLAIATFQPCADDNIGQLEVNLVPLASSRPSTGRTRVTLLAWLGATDVPPNRAWALLEDLRAMPVGA